MWLAHQVIRSRTKTRTLGGVFRDPGEVAGTHPGAEDEAGAGAGAAPTQETPAENSTEYKTGYGDPTGAPPGVVNEFDSITKDFSLQLDLFERSLSPVENNKFLNLYFGVVNLSNRNLSLDELHVLGNGLKFCPTPPMYDHGDLKESIDKFFRSASLTLFFSKEDDSTADEVKRPTGYSHPDLKLPSRFNPPMPSMLEHIYQNLLEKILSHCPNRLRDRNLTQNQYSIIERLADDTSIVIKKADKGSNIVIQNRLDYIKEGIRQLSDSKFYTKCKEDLTMKHYHMVQDVVLDLFNKKYISEQTYKFLTTGGKRTSVFYLLPKIYKRLVDPPGRPIVSSMDSPTEKISMMLDLILQPQVLLTKSYIKDTPDFLRKLEDVVITQDCWMIALDVSSLYTNIPQRESLEEMTYYFERSDSGIPTRYLSKLLELVLQCNNFQFNKKHYLQVNGTAMGTRVAPTYANLFMDSVERKYIYTYHKPPKYWFRFIDDIWAIFEGTRTELDEFISHINSCHESIKFTAEISKDSVVFLDVKTYTSEHRILSTLHVKETDSHS